MHCEKINLNQTGYFNNLFLDYLDEKHVLKEFYRCSPQIGNISDLLKNRQFEASGRQVLVKVLHGQYKNITIPDNVKNNIDRLLKPETFTVTTGHQLNLFTGPMYFIYKIVTVINTCKKLKQEYPEYHFVPVYWMASEDHDLDEIRSFTLFGKTYSWDTEQTGPVGRMKTGSIRTVIDKLPENVTVFEKAYMENDCLSDAVRYYVNELFGDSGLVVLDADSSALKSRFVDIMKDDLVNHHANDLVESTSSRLGDMGYNTQVYPRAINLFFLENEIRGRIVREKGTYQILDSDLFFTPEEILKIVEESPEKFSPNVILRPVYQEVILPNIIYVGGPAEVAYWLQLKDVFDYYKIPLPMILPRNFALIIGKSLNKKLSNLFITGKDLFGNLRELKDKHLEKKSTYTFSLESEKKILHEIFESIRNKTKAVDKSLESFIGAEEAKSVKNFENIEKRLTKAEEKKDETSIKQIESLKEKLFPGGKLQERVENFLTYYLNDPEFIHFLLDTFDPFDFRMNICYED